jgi:hypothetical protein
MMRILADPDPQHWLQQKWKLDLLFGRLVDRYRNDRRDVQRLFFLNRFVRCLSTGYPRTYIIKWVTGSVGDPDPHLDADPILMFMSLPDPHPDPLVTSTDPAPNPSIINQK